MAAAVASWKAFVAATAAGADAYGPECAALREHGVTALAETHFVESVEVRCPVECAYVISLPTISPRPSEGGA